MAKLRFLTGTDINKLPTYSSSTVGQVYFLTDTTNSDTTKWVGKIIYDSPTGRLVMSTNALSAEYAGNDTTPIKDKYLTRLGWEGSSTKVEGYNGNNTMITSITLGDRVLPLAGGTMTGAINLANNVLNKVGDDASFGDHNKAGSIGIKGNNGATTLTFLPYSGNVSQSISTDGNGTMTVTGTLAGAFKGNLTGTASTATNLANAASWAWVNGTSAGPTATMIVGGKTTNIAAIPSASASISGVLTTGVQTIAGRKTFNNGVTLADDLNFSAAKNIHWNDGTIRQRLLITDDSTAGTAVFTFQQSIDTGANYTDLFTIKDDGTIIAKTFVGNVTGNVSGSSGSCTGNAATATKLQTARKINGTAFDGSADITTEKWGKSRSLSISATAGTTGTSVDGSANATLIVPSTMTGFASITSTKFIGALQGNASSATEFSAAKSVTLTGDVTGTASSKAGWSIATTIADNAVTTSKIKNGNVTNAKLQYSSMSIAGNSVSLGGTLTADTLRTSLGLSNALHFIGFATVAITDGSTTDPVISGYTTKTAGDVVIDKDKFHEYVWTGTAWEKLGGDSSYKVTQGTVASPSTSGSTIAFIDTISQDANGVITATKKNVREASVSQSGVVGTGAQTFAGNKTFSGQVYITNASDASSSTGNSGALIIGSASGEHLAIDGNEIMAKSNSTTVGTLYLNDEGGTIQVGAVIQPKTNNTINLGTSSLKYNTVYATTFSGNATSANKVNKALTFGSKTYDGSSAQTITLADLGGQAAGNYKTVQTAVSSPSASGNDISFIDTISQNANGVITATRKTVRDASASQSGIVNTGAQTFAGEKTLNNNLYFANISTTANTTGKTLRGVYGAIGDNDGWRIAGGATASNAGFLEIATCDDGNEPIYVRQYSGGGSSYGFATVARTLTLLDTSGNTQFPGSVTAPTFIGSLSGNATTATNADKLDGYHRSGLYETPGTWISANGYTKTVTVNGDVNTYYPVVITTAHEKSAINYISVHKNLGSKTASYPGNHSNGTSSMWLIYEGRYWGWDGNGGYLKCWYYSMPYAELCAKAETAGSGAGSLVVYLRGGGTDYSISTTYNSTVTVYLSDTNIGSSTYPVNVSPTTTIGNRGKISNTVLGYGNIEGTASNADTLDGYHFLDLESRYVNVTGDTMTGLLNMQTENNVALNFRPQGGSYYTTISYQTAGNEALVFATKNAVTSFIFANGEDSITNHASDRWYSITPGLQIKNNCVSIGSLIGHGVTPSYKLLVNGTSCFNDNIAIKTGKDIKTIGTKATSSMIRFIDNTSDAYGNGISIGGGGVTIIGSGESAQNLSVAGGTEILYLLSDGAINLEANADTITNRIGAQITSSGNIIPVKAEAANSNAQSLGVSGNRWSKLYVGSADTYGSSTVPVYWNNGVPTAISSYSGNSATATKLATARNFKIGNTSKSFNGTADVTWTHAEIGATVSNTWTNGTTSGPTLSTTVNGVIGTAVAVPVASTSYSGVINTTTQSFAGLKTFTSGLNINTATNTKPLYISRTGSTTNEVVEHGVDDSVYTIKYTNDETANSICFRLINTDTEDGTKDNTTDSSIYLTSFYTFYPGVSNVGSIGTSSNKWANMWATTFNGNLNGLATKATQDSDGNAINSTYLKKRGMIETNVSSVTSGTTAGTRSSLRIYGTTYGNDATYLKTSGKFSYGDPGPQIQFSSAASGGQQGAIIFTDHDTIGTGVSWSFVTDQGDAYVIAPRFKALTNFIGNLSGNADSATKLLTARNIVIGNKTNSFNGTTNITYNLQDILIRAGNEFNYTADGISGLWFNYKTQSGNSATTKITSYSFGNGQLGTSGVTLIADNFSGNAATATALTSSAGNAGQPVYFSGGKPVAIDWHIGNSGVGEHNANNVNYNFCGYYTSNGPATSLGASTTDGALYAQAYSTSWVGQIAQDYRNGGLYVRGKNNGTWQAWYKILDTRNYTETTDSRYVKKAGDTMTGNLTAPSVYTSNWFRSTGSTGWYSETYGGGWYMSDSTYVRSYNNKMVYSGGKFLSPSTASSWLDGQRYARAAYNIEDATNSDSYWPWMRQTNSNSEKWFSFGTLGTSFYWIGSSTSRTDNGYDYGMQFNVANGYLTGCSRVYNAVWNDYAEFRESDITEPGRVIIENGDGTLSLATKRLQRGAEVVSDTYGFAIGQTDQCNTPIAASGRVLAYTYEPIEEYKTKIGWPVCSGPNGTVSIMTEEEEERYPSRIIGTISEIPSYDEWGTGKVKTKGRVWIRIK